MLMELEVDVRGQGPLSLLRPRRVGHPRTQGQPAQPRSGSGPPLLLVPETPDLTLSGRTRQGRGRGREEGAVAMAGQGRVLFY